MRLRRCVAFLVYALLATFAVVASVTAEEEQDPLKRLQNVPQERLAKEQLAELEDLDRQKREREDKERHELEKRTKYFHEPGRDDLLGHYDIRYFHGLVSYEERTHTLTHMIRAYLDFFRDRGLETWIAHGTLLGWWWNGKVLPWDWDIDAQVSGATLAHLAAHHNRTLHVYSSPDGAVRRTYLLDVNPWQWQREHGDGFNVIDARWIDTHNGLFIDITGLSETEPEERPGVWSCKNRHDYRVRDLYPLRESSYEGVRALVPFAYELILREEYEQKSLALEFYEGHRWNLSLGEWVKTAELVDEEERDRLIDAVARLKAEEETLREKEARGGRLFVWK